MWSRGGLGSRSITPLRPVLACYTLRSRHFSCEQGNHATAEQAENVRYITDAGGKRVAVILDIATYTKMQDDLDEHYCKRAYERAVTATDAEIACGEVIDAATYAAQTRPENCETLKL